VVEIVFGLPDKSAQYFAKASNNNHKDFPAPIPVYKKLETIVCKSVVVPGNPQSKSFPPKKRVACQSRPPLQ
jgi:hypothetical protein